MIDNTTNPATADDLLAAADRAPAIVERRSIKKRRVAHDRRSRLKQTVALEISPSGIELAIVCELADGKSRRLITDHFPFDRDSGPSNDRWDTNELASAIKTLVDRHKLSGQKAVVGISGDLCVTRALFGENEEVESGLAELAERSHRYLALGRDEKLCCFSDKPVDAKRKRAWMTVSKRSVVHAIADAANHAGLRLIRMEHALVAICRALGDDRFNDDAPVLVVADSPDGVSLNISYRGQMLLDYRPATTGVLTSCTINAWADTIKRHIKCLRRYLDSQVSRDAKPLSTVYLVGRKSVDPDVVTDLKEQCGLDVRALPISEFMDELQCDQTPADCSEMFTAIWMASSESKRQEQDSPTDILATLRPGDRIGLGPMLRAVWPLIAAACLIAMLFGFAKWTKSRSVAMERQIESLQTERIEAGRIRVVLQRYDDRQAEAMKLKKRIPKPSWNFILRQAGQQMPQGTWLESLTVDQGPVTIIGASFTDDAIYDYIARLKGSVAFSRVSLTSTQSIRTPNGPAFRFEISAEMANFGHRGAATSFAIYDGRDDADESSQPNIGEDQNG
tara:strand:- start:230890 stop:232581 length:1692 start_codon:yes stop_codon:yes gene_type:complete